MAKPLLFGVLHLCAGGAKAATVDPARRKTAGIVKRRIVMFGGEGPKVSRRIPY